MGIRDLIYYTKIRWLCHGNYLLRFRKLREELETFMNKNVHNISEPLDDQWLLDLSRLTNIAMKPNYLNQKLQGENKLITDPYKNIKALVAKLQLYENHLRSSNLIHFPLLNDCKSDHKNFFVYSTEITKSFEEFNTRFSYIQKFEEMLTNFLTPFNVEVESVPPSLPMQLLGLQSSIELKSLCEGNKIEYYQKYILKDNFPNLKRVAMCIISALGTYYCESFFFQIKPGKNKVL
ncbi:dimer_Tnp_hAT domain-containing protein [Trichonephila inaurata madagascariensis]|uniref:Dimer_Tnp_hAT domain-containing protein n=1 Tax=Trichonephila inaurata madagascariensis TaxID=2747483 RepID=A0A8X7C2N7_9ARAC|nr:dimer_Tnp_hAT domain-containing protein [Trichonephila inaurata madagascariensis]